MTPEEKAKIDAMSHEDLCRLWRFAPLGDDSFRSDTEAGQYMTARFHALGGFTPELSKMIGWNES